MEMFQAVGFMIGPVIGGGLFEVNLLISFLFVDSFLFVHLVLSRTLKTKWNSSNK